MYGMEMGETIDESPEMEYYGNSSEPEVVDYQTEILDTNEQTIEQTNETDEREDFTLESFLQAPDEFNSHEDAIAWYAERFQVVKEDLLNPDSDVGKYYRSKYMDQALSTYDSEIQGFKEEFLAMKANPREYLMQYIPEALALHGIEPILSEQQVMEKVENDLTQMFGPDYKSKWNPAELIYPNSFSNQVLQSQNSLLNKYNELNATNAQVYQQWNKNIIDGKSNLSRFEGAQEQEIIETIRNENYTKFTKEYGFDDASYNQFIEEASKKTIELEDLHKVVYFDGYLKQAYEKGLNDAKQGLYNKINQEGNSRKIVTPRIKSMESNNDDQTPWVYNSFHDMVIPNY